MCRVVLASRKLCDRFIPRGFHTEMTNGQLYGTETSNSNLCRYAPTV